MLVELRQARMNLPVVFLTGHAFSAQEHLAFDRGAVDFIDKARGVENFGQASAAFGEGAESAAARPSVSLVVRGKLVLNPNVRRAFWNHVDVGLTMVEYNIVHLISWRRMQAAP